MWEVNFDVDIRALLPSIHFPTLVIHRQSETLSIENARYLAGVKLSPNVRCVDGIASALDGAQMIVFVVPSHAPREVAREAAPHRHRA